MSICLLSFLFVDTMFCDVIFRCKHEIATYSVHTTYRAKSYDEQVAKDQKSIFGTHVVTRRYLSGWPIGIGTITHYTRNVTLSIIKSTIGSSLIEPIGPGSRLQMITKFKVEVEVGYLSIQLA